MSDSITSFLAVGILVIAFCLYLYTKRAKENNEILNERRIIESFPNFVSTLGVIGTFLGITIGLAGFNTSPDKIDASIATLLGGLKTAFLTSLAGMFGSMVLRWFIDKSFDQQDDGVSSAEQASITICNEIRKISQQMNTTVQSSSELQQLLIKEIKEINKSQGAFFNSVLSQLNSADSNIQTSFNSVLSQLNSTDKNIQSLVLLNENQDKNIASLKSNIDEINNNLSEVLDIENSNVTVFQEQLDETKKYSEILRAEVDEIETKMTETNKLLTAKFDEFSDLLKKSNTEALVEVMKKVTEEFQKQMSDLISKLVQENFEQLNASVERLNAWQQENKEMINQLTSQYKQMAVEFEGTSNHLTNVANDTNLLVSDGGKLSKLISQLNKVMVDDQKFVEITKKLEQSASFAKDSIEKFDQSNKALDSWIQKHKNFVEEVEKLIAKLDELNKIRDYNEKFWSDTKRGMNEGIAIIQKGSESLNSQLTDLDKQFYERLSTTLGELDACIQAMVNGKEK